MNNIKEVKSGILQGLSNEEVGILMKDSCEIEIEIGQTIIRKDIIEENIFILNEGSARMLATDDEGELITVQHCYKGDTMGIIDVIRQKSTECVIAREQSKATVIHVDKVLELLAVSKTFRKNVNNIQSKCEDKELEELKFGSRVIEQNKTTIKNKPVEETNANEDRLILSTYIKGYEDLVGKAISANKIIEIQSKSKIPLRLLRNKIKSSSLKEGEVQDHKNIWGNEGLKLQDYGVRELEEKDLNKSTLLKVRNTDDQYLAILKMIANEFSCACPVDIYEEIINENLSRLGGIPIQGIGQMLELMGLQTQLISCKKENIRRVEKPSIIQIDQKCWILLEGLKGDFGYNPKYGRKNLDDLLGEENEINTLLIKRTGLESTKIFGLSWFIPVIKKYRWQLIQVLIASLFIQLFQLANPLLIQQIIDKVINQSNLSALQVLGAALVLSALLQGVLTAIRTWLLIDTTDRMDLLLGSQVIDRLLRLRLRFFEQRPVGELSQRLGELANIRNFLTGTAITSALDLLFAAIYIFIMFIYSPLLAAVALSTIPIYVTMILVVAPLYRRLIRKQAKFNAQTQSHLIEILSGIQTVKAQNVELNSRWKWQQRYSSQISEGFKSVVVGTTAGEIGNFLNQLSSLLIIWVGVVQVLNGELSLGQLIAFRIIAGYVTGPILRLSSLWQGYQQVSVSMERLADIVDQAPEEDESDISKISLPKIKGNINFKGVTFKFDSKSKTIIDNVSLQIKEGSFVGIVGRSGSGKSTLVKLIPKLYNIDKGKILIDNYDIDKVTIQSVRKQIGIVPQDCLLFEGTIKDNISLNNPDASEQEIIEAAKIADAHDFIMELTGGYATNLGEKGAGLSGGQRQRIAIARTILQNPEMLILDEATSALDYETESRVCRNLQDKLKGRTVLFITHRLNTIKDSDKIILMHNGKIVEEGNHNELMDKGLRYKTLFESQGFND